MAKTRMININMDVIQQYLKASHITQKDVADYLGISLRTYGYWREQNRIPADAFVEICCLFGWLDTPEELEVILPNGIQV